MNKNEMICVVCPVGCHLKVSVADSMCQVEGNQCERGREYALRELNNPIRTVTSTVKIDDLSGRRLPVKTQHPFPKGKMLALIKVLKRIVVKPPVKCGQVILENALGTGIHIVSTKTIYSPNAE